MKKPELPTVGASYFGVFVCSIFEAGKLVSCLLQNGWLSLSVPGLKGGGLPSGGLSLCLGPALSCAEAEEEPSRAGQGAGGTPPAASQAAPRVRVATLDSAAAGRPAPCHREGTRHTPGSN